MAYFDYKLKNLKLNFTLRVSLYELKLAVTSLQSPFRSVCICAGLLVHLLCTCVLTLGLCLHGTFAKMSCKMCIDTTSNFKSYRLYRHCTCSISVHYILNRFRYTKPVHWCNSILFVRNICGSCIRGTFTSRNDSTAWKCSTSWKKEVWVWCILQRAYT